MNSKRFKCIMTVLGRYELPFLEKQFVGRAKEYFEDNGTLTEQQESILEGIYREKFKWMKKSAGRDVTYSTKSSA